MMGTQRKIYVFGALTLLLAAIFSKGYYHFDEHFQILEFAAFKLGITPLSNMPWEYTYKMRSAIQPSITIVIYRLYALVLPPDPFIIATITRLLSATLSFAGIVLLLKTFLPEIQKPELKQTMLWLSFFLWFAVFNEVRFSSENWSGIIFLIGLCLYLSNPALPARRVVFAGVLFGISFMLRFHSLFLIAGFMAWLLLVKKEKYTRLTLLCIAILSGVAIGVFADHWYYGEWTFTSWNYFYQNVVLNKSASFGVLPWWYYLDQITVNAVPPFSLIYIAAFFLFFIFYPKHVLTFILVPFILIHFTAGHKELRFIFPIEYYLPFLLVMTTQRVLDTVRFSAKAAKALKFFIACFWITNFALLAGAVFKPADGQINLYERLYYNYPTPSILYYTDENPYRRVLDIYFYKRPGLEIRHANSVDEIKPEKGKTILLATFHPEITELQSSYWNLIYRSLPQWLLKFNINNWEERTKIWYVYEMKPGL